MQNLWILSTKDGARAGIFQLESSYLTYPSRISVYSYFGALVSCITPLLTEINEQEFLETLKSELS